MSTEVTLSDPETFNEGLAAVRDDESPVDWALFGHVDDNPNVIALEETGAEGLEEMTDKLLDGQAQYALVRLAETIDMSTTVKFIYVRWSGANVPFLKRGKYGVVQGSIEKEFAPYHCNIETDTKDELTLEYVMTKLQEQSGQKSKVLEATVAKTRPERGFTSGTTTKIDSTGAAPTQASHVKKVGKMGSSFTGMTGMAKASGGLKADGDMIEALESVRNDTDDTQWCVIGYVDNNPKNPLTVVETSTEGLDEFVAYITGGDAESLILFGYIRVSDEVDGIKTVKFAYIQWIGDSVKPMAKAKASTQKGALENFFKPFHVSIFATAANEVNNRVIMDKVSSASGSKINIKP